MEVLSVLDVLLKTEDSPLLEIDGLAYNLSEDVGIIERLVAGLGSWCRNDGLGSLIHKDTWSREDLSLKLIRLKVDLKIPLLDFLGAGDHVVEVGDTLDPVIRTLEKALADISHDLLVLSDLGGDAYENAELRWQIDVLLLLLDLKEGLSGVSDLGFVDLLEIV